MHSRSGQRMGTCGITESEMRHEPHPMTIATGLPVALKDMYSGVLPARQCKSFESLHSHIPALRRSSALMLFQLRNSRRNTIEDPYHRTLFHSVSHHPGGDASCRSC